MANKVLNARLRVRYDTYANWMKAENDPVLLKGEVAVATIPAAADGGVASSDTSLHLPAVVVKVGDGTHKYSELPFLQAKAGDVYDWAKAATKPGYNAGEITLADEGNHTEVSTVEAALAEIYTKIEQILGEGEGVSLESLQAAIDTLNGAANVDGSVAHAVQAEADRIDAIVGAPDEGKTIQQEIDAVEADVANLQSNVPTAIQDAIDAEVSRADAAYAAKSYEGKVDTLIGDDTSKSVRAISAEEVAKIVANADTKYDTLKEIADWILSDVTGAAKMANDIDALKTKTGGLTKEVDGEQVEATVKEYVDNAITGLNAGDFALDSDLDALETRVEVNEGKLAGITGTVAAAIATAKQEAVESVDFAVTEEANKVVSAFEVQDGQMVANSVKKVTLADVATSGKAVDLSTAADEYIILFGGDASDGFANA